MNKLSQVVGIMLTLILIVFSLVGAMNFFSAPDRNGLFGYKGYVVTSGSMEPAFSPGDYIVVKDGSFDDVQEGEVITFLDEDTLVTHRVIEKTSEEAQTKGDANENMDMTPVVESAYVGTFQFAIPIFGYFILFLQKPFVFPVLVFLVGAYLIYLYLTSSDEEENTVSA